MKSEEFFRNMQEFNNKYLEAVNLLLQKKFDNGSDNGLDTSLNGSFGQMIDVMGIKTAYIEAVTNFANNPAKFFEHNLEYASKVSNLMFHFADKMQNGAGLDHQSQSLYESSPRDRRFKDKAWQESLYFNFVKQFYLMSSEWYKSLVKKLDVPDSQRKILDFYTDQMLNAACPTNFVNLNPEVLNELVATNGQNLIKGIENFLEDIKHSEGIMSVSTAASNMFSVGVNLASTRGKVIFQNDLAQLICYEPEKTVFEIPIFIIPPWINKYYILDLSKENSFVKYLVDAGFQVYLLSWVNPSLEHADKNFEHYLKEGVIEPMEFLREKFGYKEFNVIGYCLGGTLASCAASYFAAKNKNYIKNMTLLTTMLDFSEPGDLGLFINERALDAISQEIERRGFFSGKYMSYAFSMLRANELIWSFVVNNYLLGRKPMAFDLLYWNADNTNLPAAMHKFYMENMYIHNKLIEKGGISLLGVKIDLSKIDIPVFFVSASEDHIAPWESTFKGMGLFAKNPKEKPVFCLSGSGHIAGIINPPMNRKYHYYLNDNYNTDPTKWLEGATQYTGSWWDAWSDWLISRSGKMTNSINYKELDYLSKAPGSYVKMKI